MSCDVCFFHGKHALSATCCELDCASLNPDHAVARLDLKLNQVEPSWTKVIIYIFAVVLRQATDSSTVSCHIVHHRAKLGHGVKSVSASSCTAIQETIFDSDSVILDRDWVDSVAERFFRWTFGPDLCSELWGGHESVPLGAWSHEHIVAGWAACWLFAHDQIIGKSEPNPLDHRPCVCPSSCNHRALHVGWTLGHTWTVFVEFCWGYNFWHVQTSRYFRHV